MLYHFKIELSDIDRSVYESLDFRLYRHPSEIMAYLLTRALGFAHSFADGLDFSAEGLSDPEVPAIRSIGVHGSVDLWIEIGNPSARKLHKAGKLARQVVVYTYKSGDVLVDDIIKNQVHRAQDIQIYSIDLGFLDLLEKQVKSNNQWSLLIQQGRLTIGIADQSFDSEIRTHRVPHQ